MKCYICDGILTDREENVMFVLICKMCLKFMEKSSVRQAEEMVNLTNKISELTYTIKKIKEDASTLLARYD